MGTPIGLDFSAVMAVAAVQGVDVEMLAEVLPSFETVLLAALNEGEAEGHEGLE